MHVASWKMTFHRSVKSKDQIYLIQHPSGGTERSRLGVPTSEIPLEMAIALLHPPTQDTVRNIIRPRETISLARNK